MGRYIFIAPSISNKVKVKRMSKTYRKERDLFGDEIFQNRYPKMNKNLKEQRIKKERREEKRIFFKSSKNEE